MLVPSLLFREEVKALSNDVFECVQSFCDGIHVFGRFEKPADVFFSLPRCSTATPTQSSALFGFRVFLFFFS